MFKLNHHHNHHKSDLLRSYCTMLLVASVLILLLSLCPQSTQAQLAGVAQKFKLDKIADITGAETINIDLNNNRIRPGDPIVASKLRGLDLSRMTWDSVDDSRQYTILLLDFGVNGTKTRNLFTAINVPGKKIQYGQQVVVYEPPNVPCVVQLKHRLVLLAYLQRGTIDLVDIASISVGGQEHQNRREMFNLEAITRQHSLNLQAANIFLASGESNGICSASSSLYPNSFLTLFTSIMIVMVMSIQKFYSSKPQQ